MTLRLRMPDLGWQLGLVAAAAALGLVAGVDPSLAVVTALGLAFVALLMTTLTTGLCLFAFVSFLEVLPAASVLSFTKLAGLLLAVSWLATVAVRDQDNRQFFSAHPIATYGLVLFLAWAALSTLWAESPGAAVTATSRFGLNFLLLPIVYTAVRERKHALWVTVAFVAGSVASAAYGLIAGAPSDEEGRLSGAVSDPNEIAAVLVAGVVFAGVLTAVFKAPLLRFAAASAAVFCAVSIFFTLSRGGLIALALALVASLFVAGRWRARAATLALVAALGTVAYFAAFAPLEARERVTVIEGGSGRSDIWTVGGRMVEDKPVTGVGAGNFEISSIHYLLEPGAILRDEFIVDKPKVAHNTYLQIVAELGLVGLVLFLSVLAFSLVCAVKAARRFTAAGDVRMELLSRGLIVAVIGILVADIFISAQFSNQLWLLLALGPSLLAVSRQTG
jgi:putative inorganic carbon (HCO3(-)) transporter